MCLTTILLLLSSNQSKKQYKIYTMFKKPKNKLNLAVCITLK